MVLIAVSFKCEVISELEELTRTCGREHVPKTVGGTYGINPCVFYLNSLSPIPYVFSENLKFPKYHSVCFFLENAVKYEPSPCVKPRVKLSPELLPFELVSHHILYAFFFHGVISLCKGKCPKIFIKYPKGLRGVFISVGAHGRFIGKFMSEKLDS